MLALLKGSHRGFIAGLCLIVIIASLVKRFPLEPDKRWRDALESALDQEWRGTWYYDRHGELLRVIPPKRDQTSHHVEEVANLAISLDQVPTALTQSVLCLEDQGYYSHNGVPLRGVLRALWRNLRSGRRVAGGSGITQQLIKRYRGRSRGIWDKLAEARHAIWLEERYTKDQILSAYLNQISFAHQLIGVWRASWRYFGKPPHRLSIAQSAYLASLPFAPSRLSPLRDVKAAIPRQRAALNCLLREGKISKEVHARSVEESIEITNAKPPFNAPHIVESVHYQRAFNKASRSNLPLQSKEVLLTIDQVSQRRAQDIVSHYLSLSKGSEIEQLAAVALSTDTGEVLFWIGSGDYHHADAGQVDHVLGLRLPGSTLKPFLYGLALDRGFNLDSLVPDQPIYFKTARGQYRPQNYDHETRGEVELMSALAMSLNIPSVWLLNQLGVSALLDQLRSAGLESLKHDAQHYGLGLSLGDGEVRLIDLANAYRGLAHNGLKRPWTVLKNSSHRREDESRFMSPRAAQAILQVLSNRKLRAPSFDEHGPLSLPFKAAVKTGTSQGYTNAWTIGLSTEFTVGVWVKPQSGVQLSGAQIAAPLWKELMLSLHEENSPQNFKIDHLFERDRRVLEALQDTEESSNIVRVLPNLKDLHQEGLEINFYGGLQREEKVKAMTPKVKLLTPPHGSVYSWLPSRADQDNQLRAEALVTGDQSLTLSDQMTLEWSWSGGELLPRNDRALSLWFSPWSSAQEEQRLCVKLFKTHAPGSESKLLSQDCSSFRVIHSQ